MISKRQIAEIIARPFGNVPEKALNRIVLRLLQMNELDFIDYAQTIIPMRINRLSKNRYYLS